MSETTEADRLLLRRWEGVPDNLLAGMNDIDQRALERCDDDRWAESRREVMAARSACIELRTRLGVDHKHRIPRPR